MSIKILTKKAVDNTNIDGARQNHFNAGMRSGIVKGALSECNVYASSTNVLIVGSGELRLSGHQIVIEDYESFTISNRPTSPVRYSIIAEINVVEENPEFNMFIQSSDVALVQQNLYSTINGDGKFQLELARFTIDTNGYITDITRTADLITGASENGYDYINIGEVTTTMLATGVNAEVNVENVTDEQTGEKKTNFSFGLPQTAGTIIEVGGEPVSNIGFTEDPQSQLDELKKGTALPVGSTFYSSVILDDPAFHLLDGSSLLNTGIYEEFCTWIKGRLAGDPSAVPTCTIEQYASDMATYGQCGKFVVNDTASDLTSGGFSVLANSVKLPTITEFIASNNGGKEIGSAQLDMFKSHSHYTNTAYGTAESGGGNAIVYHTTGGYLSSETGGEETRPKNIRYPYYIVVATATKTDVQVNLDNVGNEINNINAQLSVAKACVNHGGFLTESISTSSNVTKTIAQGNFIKGSGDSNLFVSFGCNSFHTNNYVAFMVLYIDEIEVAGTGTNGTNSGNAVSYSRLIQNKSKGNHSYALRIYADSGATVTMDAYNTWYFTIQEV